MDCDCYNCKAHCICIMSSSDNFNVTHSRDGYKLREKRKKNTQRRRFTNGSRQMSNDWVQNDLSDLGPETTAMTTITQTGRTAIRRRRRNGISHANLFIMSLPSSPRCPYL